MDQWHILFPESALKRKLCWCENPGTNQTLRKIASPTLYPHPGRSKTPPPLIQRHFQVTALMLNLSNKQHRNSRMWKACLHRHSAFLKSPIMKHAAVTCSKQIPLIEASNLKSEPFSAEWRPHRENGMLFTSASLWLLSDVTLAISSFYAAHTHTHTHWCWVTVLWQ